MAPMSDRIAKFRRCTECKGVSRTIIINLRRSFKTTSAALVSKVLLIPVAISPTVRIEQGATTIPIVLKEPLAGGAPISSTGYQVSAIPLTSATFQSVSCAIVSSADLVIMRCVETSNSRNISSNRIPYIAPDAPLIPTMILCIVWSVRRNSSYRISRTIALLNSCQKDRTPIIFYNIGTYYLIFLIV